MVGFEIIGSDDAIRSLQVVQHGGTGDVGVSHLVVGEDDKVKIGNGVDDLFLEFLAGGLVERMFGEGGGILPIGFGDLRAGRVARM